MICEYKTEDEGEIKKHMDTKHGKCACSKCSESFWDNDGLNEHMQNEHVSITIKCKLCEYTSNTMAGLGDHKMDKHYFKCEYCMWCVKSEAELTKHMEQVHDHKSTETIEVVTVNNDPESGDSSEAIEEN